MSEIPEQPTTKSFVAWELGIEKTVALCVLGALITVQLAVLYGLILAGPHETAFWRAEKIGDVVTMRRELCLEEKAKWYLFTQEACDR